MFLLIVEYLDSILYKPLSGGKGKKIYKHFFLQLECIYLVLIFIHMIFIFSRYTRILLNDISISLEEEERTCPIL